jgi:hypothetical protein
MNPIQSAPTSVTSVTSGSISQSPLIDQVGLRWCNGGKIDESLSFDNGAISEDYIRAGTLFGRITASGLLVPVRNTTLSASANSGQANITVTDPHGFMEGDTISVAGVSHTIDSINYSTKVITLTANLAASKAAGDAVIGRGTALAGSEIAIGVLVTDLYLKDEFSDSRIDPVAYQVIASACAVRGSLLLGDVAAAFSYSTNRLQHVFVDNRY